MKTDFRGIIKSLLFVCLITFLSLPSFAQVRGGIKGGANFLYSDWEIPGLSRSYSGVSYHVGVYGTLTIREQLLLQSEIQFNSFKIDYSGEVYTANYISIPVICAYTFADNLVNIHAGPQVSLLLSAKPDFLDTAIDNLELALVVGSGLTIKRFSLTARYILGVTNLASDDVKEFFPEATIKNSNFQLSLGYQLVGKTQ
jgi:hypothetical protein